ncbi:hypothetical protein JCM8097_008981 [Rhodosporidiobolus ruineniae]
MLTSDPEKPSHLDRLPDELVLAVVASLDYLDLGRVGRTCKRMRELIKDPSLAANLFRQPPPKAPLDPGAEIKLHPALHLLDGVMRTPGYVTLLSRNGDETGPNLFDCPPFLDEYATRPACTTLICFMCRSKYYLAIEDPGGVTVKQFLAELNEYWTGVPIELCGKDRKANRALMAGRHAPVRELYRSGWPGWSGVSVLNNGGAVQLETDFFYT